MQLFAEFFFKFVFQPTLPARGATLLLAGQHLRERNFNPRSPHGERLPSATRAFGTSRFQSTLPARGATWYLKLTDGREAISIHAPRTGSDRRTATHKRRRERFQSTLPARGATAVPHRQPHGSSDFNPRSPHGERRHFSLPPHWVISISIHAPRTGSDASVVMAAPGSADFNPRSPHGERQLRIRQPREHCLHFNPRSPHGERPIESAIDAAKEIISIHAPRTGSDLLLQEPL